MRQVLKDIISTINCDEQVALQVEYVMECSDFDFSEATEAEFKTAINDALIDLG